MKLHIDMPDLPLRAFQRFGRSIQPQGKSNSAPETPNYEAAAEKTAAGNLENARYATQANRPNQITPWGTIAWDNGSSFDQAGYDAAMNAYNQGMASGQGSSGGGSWQRQLGPSVSSSSGDSGTSSRQWQDVWVPNGNPGSPGSAGGLTMPDRAAFTNPGGDNWTSTVTLSPEMQALFDQQNKLQQGMFGAQDQALGRVNQMMGQGFDMSKIPAAGTALNMSSLPGYGQVYDPNQATNNAAELLMSRMNPELDRQQEALRGQLANQGITQGSEAYNRAMTQNQYGRNDANVQAQLQGIGLGMQQQGQTFGQQTTNQQLAAALQNQQFGQQQGLRGQSMQEQAYLRNLPLNELNALRSGNQVGMPQFGGFSQQATTGGADYTGAAQNQYQSNLAASNAGAAGQSGMMGGILGIGGGILGGIYGGPGGAMAGSSIGSSMGGMFSDRRLKKNIRRIGKADNGLNIYSYQYVWGGPDQIGYMADEVQKVSPHAVGESGGYLTVDYGQV